MAEKSAFENLPDSGWTKEQLTGKHVSFPNNGAGGGGSSSPSKSGKDKIDPMLWGRPGHLSEAEADTYVSRYRESVDTGTIFFDVVLLAVPLLLRFPVLVLK